MVTIFLKAGMPLNKADMLQDILEKPGQRFAGHNRAGASSFAVGWPVRQGGIHRVSSDAVYMLVRGVACEVRPTRRSGGMPLQKY